jgi:hypothetical protein
MALATDIGPNGWPVIDTGSRWIPMGDALLGLSRLHLIKSPTINANASGTANGATTLATALSTAVARGYFYVPANSIVASHAAGWYYGEMSDTTAITFYNNTYTPAAGVVPTEPTTKVPFSGAVPGGTGVLTEVTGLIYAVPADLLGLYGELLPTIFADCNNNANTKSVRVRVSGTACVAQTLTTAPIVNGVGSIRNAGSKSQQVSAANLLSTTIVGLPNVTTIDTSVATEVSITLQTVTSGADYAILRKADLIARVGV